MLDDRHPEVWGNIALLCLRRQPRKEPAASDPEEEEEEGPEFVDTVDVTEASQAFLVAMQLNLKDKDVLADLGKAFWEVGKHFFFLQCCFVFSLFLLPLPYFVSFCTCGL